MLISVSIPEDSVCLLKNGQKVNFDTPFLEKKIPSESIIPISAKLKVKPGNIFHYLKKLVGDSVEKNEIIAEKKSIFSTRLIISESKGQIKEINHFDGSLIMTNLDSISQIKANFKGEVESITKNQVKIKVNKSEELLTKNISKDFGGELIYINDKNAAILSQNTTNKIMVIETFSNYLKSKAEALGIKGFISLTVPDKTLQTAYVQLRTAEDFKKIFKLNYPYCLTDKFYSKIYFYQ